MSHNAGPVIQTRTETSSQNCRCGHVSSATFPELLKPVLTARGIHIHQDFFADTIGGILRHPTTDPQARFGW
jgi:hypothetical protein